MQNLRKIIALYLFFFCYAQSSDEVTQLAEGVDRSLACLIVGIHNGQLVEDKGKWPWMAYIEETGTQKSVRCGAALINREWIVTAAHCQ